MSAPKGPRKGFLLRLPIELHEQLTHLAIARKKKLNDLLVELLQDEWEAAPEKEQISSHIEMLEKLSKKDEEDQVCVAA
jgi:hypothetical protein